jgi:4-hydroxy-tetrahydrodipicolinate reductase
VIEMIKILVHGSTGTMGKIIIEMIKTSETCELSGGVSNMIVGNEDYSIFTTFAQVDVPFDVIIDFSHFSLTDALIDFCAASGKPAVIATTGLSELQEQRIVELSNQVPVFRAKNFSIGINLLAKLIQDAQAALNGFDIEIIEKHHNRKVDAPSGTAFFLADALNSNNQYEYRHGREGNQTKRVPNEIGIHAIRGGTIVGEHSVIFAGPDEIIEIKHEAHSKKVFANGALKAAQYISTCTSGLYNMNDLMSGGK